MYYYVHPGTGGKQNYYHYYLFCYLHFQSTSLIVALLARFKKRLGDSKGYETLYLRTSENGMEM